ncbi:hypothetical protein B0H34DRAFT_740587 [Crassisporium funariophilum]|nr:hypothetical protein B0H34DRAFT_740587 [Crassisporium funariophilum]
MSAHAALKKHHGSKLFQQDIVQKISSPEQLGIVLRCWHDAEDIPPVVPFADPLMRPLAYGEVGVTFLTHGSTREILSQSDLRLVDRTLQPGDYCKRSIDDVRSGVVTNVKVKGRIAHAISAVPVDGWRTMDDLEDRGDAEIGDYVAYDDWIGQVTQVFDESIVQVTSGQLVRLPELGSRLTVGETGSNILPPPPDGVQNLFGIVQGRNEGSKDVVIAVKHNAYAVAWLALNQSLDPATAENKSRPQKFWYGEDIGRLTLIRGRSDMEMRVGDRVYVKDTTGLPTTEHGQEGDATGVVQVQVYSITETATELDVLWQDGVREILKSVEVIPYLNPDEYDCWPGDHVVWKNEGMKRAAIVQSVNAAQRTALILFADTGAIELASVLELDPHGNADLDAIVPHPSSEAFGVRRGDFVFIHAIGTTNGLEKPNVPRIGEIESWVRENPFSQGQFVGWRKDLQDIGNNIASQRNALSLVEKMMQRPQKGDSKLSWCGEVTGLNLDGSVIVTHPDFTVQVYPLERLTRLYDGIEQLEDGLWDFEGSDDDHSHTEDDEQPWVMDEDGIWHAEQHNGDWEDGQDFYGGMDEDSGEELIDATGGHLDDDNSSNMEVDEAELSHDDPQLESRRSAVSCPRSEVDPVLLNENQESSSALDSSEVHGILESTDSHEDDQGDNARWKRFEILSSAPPDHAFFSSTPATPSKAFLGRLRREYQVLSSSLPESILVRAFEDRTDLLRSLIIGPENTPYEDAPFVIDWMLDSNFPNSPPIAHFLSWTNGNGRVNPNLYEEGKVCLSILGTWSGDKNEIWSSGRSSLLQAFVSIQGLVLVKEPWFCEPAYDKLRGTAEGTVNSRLYSEKAYVLSRGFVRRALEIPLGGLESEITHLYRNKKRLQKVVQDAQTLIWKSKNTPEVTVEDQDVAVPRLTAGGIIALERTLNKLIGFLDSSSLV